MMDIDQYIDRNKNFNTNVRETMYHEIRREDKTGIFKQVNTTFLMAFAIGYHNNIREDARGPNSINHVKSSYISENTQRTIIIMMLERHPELEVDGKDCLWS